MVHLLLIWKIFEATYQKKSFKARIFFKNLQKINLQFFTCAWHVWKIERWLIVLFTCTQYDWKKFEKWLVVIFNIHDMFESLKFEKWFILFPHVHDNTLELFKFEKEVSFILFSNIDICLKIWKMIDFPFQCVRFTWTL